MEETFVPRQRSRGLMTITILAVLQGVSLLFLAIITFVEGKGAADSERASHAIKTAELTMSVAIYGSLFFLILGVLASLLAWGLWSRNRWAFRLTPVFEGILILIYLCSLSLGINLYSIMQIILAGVILIYYFVDRSIRAAFSQDL